jgi:hypothetical protein
MVEPGFSGFGVVAVLVTVKSGAEFVTVDEQLFTAAFGVLAADAVPLSQLPVVMVAVLTTSPLSVDETVALNVTETWSPAARVTLKVQVLPDGLATVHVSVPLRVPQAGVPFIVRFDARVSVTTAEPPPSPMFSMSTL